MFASASSDFVANDGNGWVDIFAATLASSLDADSDRDGLPDVWEIASFGNLTQKGDGDPDQDGQSNLQEYQAGTDPTSDKSRFHVGLVGSIGAETTIQWFAAPGITYLVEFAVTLEPGSFALSYPPILGDGSLKTVPFELTGGAGFVRVRAQR